MGLVEIDCNETVYNIKKERVKRLKKQDMQRGALSPAILARNDAVTAVTSSL